MTIETCCQCAGPCVIAGSDDAIARPDLPVRAHGATVTTVGAIRAEVTA